MPNAIEVPQSSGYTIWEPHIEEPKTRFAVEFDSAGYFNVIHFAPTHRRVFVLAETADGPLAIARYHYGSKDRTSPLSDPG